MPAWGVAGAEAVGMKGASHEPFQLARPAQDKTEADPGRQVQPGAAQRKGEARDGREGRGFKYRYFIYIITYYYLSLSSKNV